MTEAFNSAMRLLARRDHGASELSQKLTRKGFHSEEASHAVAECHRLGLQNDSRFIEHYAAYRMGRGYGPLKITQELKAKGIEAELIQSVLEQDKDIWLTIAREVWRKKTQGRRDFSLSELQKYQRFMMYRGFPMEIIAEGLYSW
jgi:regulatory protein